jgi:hypothetical protein
MVKQGKVLEIPGTEQLPAGFTRIISDLVKSCCALDPQQRPAFSDVLYVLEFVLEPNKSLGQGKAIPASVWKMLGQGAVQVEPGDDDSDGSD